LGPIPNPQSPIPNPQSPIPFKIFILINKIQFNFKLLISLSYIICKTLKNKK